MWGNRRCGNRAIRQQRFTPTRVGKSAGPERGRVRLTVHPHTCGEIVACIRKAKPCGGSPPHVWGNRLLFYAIDSLLRFTPTRVGKSVCEITSLIHFTVHPHTCGEISTGRIEGEANIGSPPHVWGNLLVILINRMSLRFTPTRVGKSAGSSGQTRTYAVHPHTCGEITYRYKSIDF